MRKIARHVDLTAQVGSVVLKNPVLTASGTAGHGTEMEGYLDYSALGGFVTKSLSAMPWKGNAAPRLRETPCGLLNSVGLQGPGDVYKRQVQRRTPYCGGCRPTGREHSTRPRPAR